MWWQEMRKKCVALNTFLFSDVQPFFTTVIDVIRIYVNCFQKQFLDQS